MVEVLLPSVASNGQSELSIIGGSITESENEYLFEAPADGYKPSVSISKRVNDPNWSSRINRRAYFFQVGDGALYGSFYLNIIARTSGKVSIYLKDVVINPGGSRNLQVDEDNVARF